MFYTSEHLEFIHTCRLEGITWDETAELFNAKFKLSKSPDTIRITYRNHLDMSAEQIDAKMLQSSRSARKQSNSLRRQANMALDALNARDDLLEELKNLTRSLPQLKMPPKKKVKSSKKKNTVLEFLLSDIHYGKKTDTVDLSVIRERVRKFADACIFKMEIESKTYNVKEVIIAALGDIIESASMHGEESLRGCEFGNSKQVAVAIESLHADFIVPVTIAARKYGTKVTFVGVPGNHDRAGKEKTFHNPGEERLTYIIYKTLQFFAEAQKLGINFLIPKTSFALYPIFGRYFLYEHGDKFGNTKVACERHIANRSVQIGEQIYGIRLGHWHEFCMFGRGRVIINESIVGADSYSTELGFNSTPGQTIVQSVETDKRASPFYQAFPVCLVEEGQEI